MGRTGGGNGHCLCPAPPLEIGVDHVALDRPGADNRHLDHQVIETARPQAGQHVHLRPALDLEHPERIPLAEHVVDRRILARDRGEHQVLPVMITQQVQAFADAGQHAQRQYVDLQDAQGVDIVLVPFDETAIGHGPVAHWHRLGERTFSQDESTNVLR